MLTTPDNEMKFLMESFSQFIEEHRGVAMKDKGIKGKLIDRKRKDASSKRAKEKDRVKKMTQPAGHSELMSLAHGVVEDEKKKPCKKGQKFHDKDGRWTSKDKAVSWTSNHYEPNHGRCKSGKMRHIPSSGGHRITKHPCGAKRTGPNGGIGKHPYKCSTGEKAWEGLIIEKDGESFIKLSALNRILSEISLDEDQSGIDSPNSFCNARGYYKVPQILNFINSAVDASKGELGKK